MKYIRESEKNIKRSFVIKIMMSITLVTTMIFVFAGCGEHSSPERVTQTSIMAVKAGDMEGFLACMEPKARAEYNAGTAVADALFDIDSDSLMKGAFGIASATEFVDYDFQITNVTPVDDTHAKVDVDLYNKQKREKTATINCMNYNGEWYIEENYTIHDDPNYDDSVNGYGSGSEDNSKERQEGKNSNSNENEQNGDSNHSWW